MDYEEVFTAEESDDYIQDSAVLKHAQETYKAETLKRQKAMHTGKNTKKKERKKRKKR